MKEMSLQRAREYWTYLQAQAKLKKQAFFDTPDDGSYSSYKDEMRAEAETYEGLAKTFAGNFRRSITSAADILHGLTVEQAVGFLGYLDKRITELEAGLEENRRKKEAALAKAQGMEYYRVESIYKDMGNLTECQIQVFENSRKNFMSILKKIW
jgi:hypothetical protein